jgi:hypothetical protein
MLFPTTPIRDNFNRSNEGPPPSASWVTPFSHTGLKVFSNQCRSATTTVTCSAAWNTVFGPNVEVYLRIPGAWTSSQGVRLFGRVASTSVYTGYFVWANSAGTRLYEVTAGVFTEIASSATVLAPGNFLGLTIVGNEIKAWRRVSSSTPWVELVSVIDGTHSGNGYIGISLPSDGTANTTDVDEFGGGNTAGRIYGVARKITAAEETLLRTPGQFVDLFAVIHPARSCLTAKLNTASLPSSNDRVAEININTVVRGYVGVGTVSIVGGQTELTGVGTLFLSELSAGSVVIIEGEVFTVQFITTNTSLEVDTAASQTYTNEPFNHFSGSAPALAGMTVWVGSTAGARDLGEVRLRADITSASPTSMKIGETSDVNWIVSPQVDRFLTVIDEMNIWPKHLRTVGPTTITISGTWQAQTTNFIVEVSGSNVFNEVKIGDYVDFAGQRKRVVAISSSGGIDQIECDTYFNLGSLTQGSVSRTRLDIYMDYDRDFQIRTTDPANPTYNPNDGNWPVPMIIFGPPSRVLFKQGSNDLTLALDASRTFKPNHRFTSLESGLSYSWAAVSLGAGLSTTTGLTPTLTLNGSATGICRVSCQASYTVSVSGSTTYLNKGYRYVYLVDPDAAYSALNPIVPLYSLDSLEGDLASGGWSARLTIRSTTNISIVRPNARCMIVARDHYGAEVQSIGQEAAEIVLTGWIVGESIVVDPEQGSASFEVQGPQYWLNKITGYPLAMKSAYAALNWLEMSNLMPENAIFHWAVWRSTLGAITDVFGTGSDRVVSFAEGAIGSLWSQANQILSQTILARMVCNRLGQVFAEIDPLLIPSSERTNITLVQNLAMQDVRAPIQIDHRLISEIGRVTLTGTYLTEAADLGSDTSRWESPYDPTAVVSKSPGEVFRTHGGLVSYDRLALASQAQGDALADLILAKDSNPFPTLRIPLAGMNRLLDIAPGMYASLSIAATLNMRSIDFDDFPVVPRRISHAYDPNAGFMSTDVEFEGYTDETTLLNGSPKKITFSY